MSRALYNNCPSVFLGQLSDGVVTVFHHFPCSDCFLANSTIQTWENTWIQATVPTPIISYGKLTPCTKKRFQLPILVFLFLFGRPPSEELFIVLRYGKFENASAFGRQRSSTSPAANFGYSTSWPSRKMPFQNDSTDVHVVRSGLGTAASCASQPPVHRHWQQQAWVPADQSHENVFPW